MAAKDIHVDHASGAKASRPALDTVLRMLRDGDTLKITRLDRLSRSVLHLVTLGAELRERGVGLRDTEQSIDTTTAEGHAMFGMLSVLAKLQRELIVAPATDSLPRALADAPAAAGPDSTPGRSPSHKSSTTPATYTVKRIADPFSAPAPPSTRTSTTRARASARSFTANRRATPEHQSAETSRRRGSLRKWRLVTRFLPATATRVATPGRHSSLPIDMRATKREDRAMCRRHVRKTERLSGGFCSIPTRTPIRRRHQSASQP